VTSYDVFANSQLVLPDMLVVCFATMAGWAFWRATSHPSARGALPLFYVAVALSVYAKGPLGLVPFLTAAAWISTEYGVRQVVSRLWSLPGAALFTGITLTWVGPFLALGARSWLHNSVWGDWLAWYIGVPRSGPELLYTVMVGFLPWTVLAPLVMANALRAWKTPAVRFALFWFTVPLLVLMASASFKPRYSLSAYPGAALLVGWWADAHGTARTRADRVIGCLALIGFLVLAASLNIPRWWHPRVRVYLTGLPWELVPVVVGLTAIGGALFWGLWSGRPALLVHGAVLATAVTLGYGIWPYTMRYNEVWNFKQFAGAVDRHAHGAEAAVFKYQSDEWMSLDFYLARPPLAIETVADLRTFLSRPDRPVVVIDARDWRTVRPGGLLAVTTWGRRVLEPGNEVYWNAVGRQRPDLRQEAPPWQRIIEPPGLRGLYAEAGVTAPEILVESFDHHIDTEQFWTIVLGSGYRGPLEAMGPEAASWVRDEVMGRLRADGVRVLSSEVRYSRAQR